MTHYPQSVEDKLNKIVPALIENESQNYIHPDIARSILGEALFNKWLAGGEMTLTPSEAFATLKQIYVRSAIQDLVDQGLVEVFDDGDDELVRLTDKGRAVADAPDHSTDLLN